MPHDHTGASRSIPQNMLAFLLLFKFAVGLTEMVASPSRLGERLHQDEQVCVR